MDILKAKDWLKKARETASMLKTENDPDKMADLWQILDVELDGIGMALAEKGR